MKTFRVILKNGSEHEVKADSIDFPSKEEILPIVGAKRTAPIILTSEVASIEDITPPLYSPTMGKVTPME